MMLVRDQSSDSFIDSDNDIGIYDERLGNNLVDSERATQVDRRLLNVVRVRNEKYEREAELSA
eukprot:CAMPEP_0185619382 /NCGR_PEP_ID=MMETSP0436-20130131/50426_1 /TAXON_ID=626734 ORGANISM="Favella taraikaensis, Strain Fe Narragansett Bay" /NCGR_SAMPLE_ID=MMETSP0436 /ASSEMBLY_ACC=CAM_ASM_000390 /LENGTH=62 /DNA_ID=CAMNT_0028258805 /DNA_START=395 /DNA_END=583 /DNA_ORIENTATION=-